MLLSVRLGGKEGNVEWNFPEGVVYEKVNSSCVVCFNRCQVVWDSMLFQRKVDGGCILSGSNDSEIDLL